MDKIGFKQLVEMDVKDANKIEQGYSKLPECGFKIRYGKKEKEDNFAEKLVEELI